MSETGKNLAGIPEAVIRRLPIYYRELSLLQRREVERISSQELANRVGVKAPQIRQDLSIFGRFGQQGYGYRVEELLAAIERILGLDRQYRLVIVGAGNIGAAVARYPSFRAKGFEVLSCLIKMKDSSAPPSAGCRSDRPGNWKAFGVKSRGYWRHRRARGRSGASSKDHGTPRDTGNLEFRPHSDRSSGPC